MKYETPELTAMTAAVNAIQAKKVGPILNDSSRPEEESLGAYEDWE